MKPLELEDYRKAWQKNLYFNEDRKSTDRIKKYMHSSSGNFLTQMSRALVLDITLKSLLLVGALTLMIFQENWIQGYVFGLIFLLGSGIIWQAIAIRKLPKNMYELDLKRALNTSAEYFRSYYKKSIFVIALTSALFFAVGSLFYLSVKYQSLPEFQIDDWAVFTSGFLMAYTISLLANREFSGFKFQQILELEKELEAGDVSQELLSKQQKSSRRLKALALILLVTGVLLLILWLVAF